MLPETVMRVALIGPGAIGCRLAAAIAGKHDTWIVDYDPARADRLNRHGVVLESTDRLVRRPIHATACPTDVPPVDIVCVCVKAYQTRSTMDAVRVLARSGAAVVSLQNGLGNAEILAEATSPEHVVCAVTSMGARLVSVGRVRDTGRGETGVAPLIPAGMPAAERFADLLTGVKLETRRSDDATALRWEKLVVNTALNPVTALWNVSNGDVVTRPELWAMAAEATREAAQVARAAGVRLPAVDPTTRLREVCRRTKSNVSSMCQDFRQQRRTEIEAITGAVVRQAQRFAMAVPVNEQLLERVREAERSWPHGRGRHQEIIPGAL